MTTIGKKHWLKITLLVLAVCAVAGLVLSVILFNQNPGRTYASASLQFSFNGAGEGKAPNGYPFDVNGIFSEEVLEKALEDSGLNGTYTTDQIKDNLTITGIYPDNIVKQMTAYTSLLDANAEQQATMADYHATQYSVVLYHDFDPKISGDTLRLNADRYQSFIAIDSVGWVTENLGLSREAIESFVREKGRSVIGLGIPNGRFDGNIAGTITWYDADTMAERGQMQIRVDALDRSRQDGNVRRFGL